MPSLAEKENKMHPKVSGTRSRPESLPGRHASRFRGACLAVRRPNLRALVQARSLHNAVVNLAARILASTAFGILQSGSGLIIAFSMFVFDLARPALRVPY